MKNYIGIDPGLTGAVAVIRGNEIKFMDAPVMQVRVGKSLKNELDPRGCTRLLHSCIGYAECTLDFFVTIEKVAPMPSFSRNKEGEVEERRSMGATSAFNFGMGFGIWIGVCAAIGLPYELVHPQSWKRRIMPGMAGGKDAGRVVALRLYPHAEDHLSRKKDHGRADALLLARYGQLTHGETLAPAPPPMATTLF